MRTFPPVRIIIPTFNDAEKLDATVESIFGQDYDQDKIFMAFVDFGSSDGTQEKILRYRKEQTGVFSLQGKRRGRTMIAEAARILDLQSVGGREFLLWPGDVLYSHCLSTIENWMYRSVRQKLPCQQVVAEVDVKEKNEFISPQKPLFSAPCHIRSYSKDSYEYVRKGFRHMILLYGRTYSRSQDKMATQQNHILWWNQLAYSGMFNNILYINEPLACFQSREYDNELDEILYRFEMGLTCFRMIQELPEAHVANMQFEPAYRLNLATYALWRAWILYNKGITKMAEDCFLLAQVICVTIPNHVCWKKMESLLAGNASAHQWLKAYFTRDEMPTAPKWPVSGFAPSLRRRWRLWRTGDHPSTWGKS